MKKIHDINKDQLVLTMLENLFDSDVIIRQ